MMKGACKNMLLKSTASLPFGQFNDIDARIGEKRSGSDAKNKSPTFFGFSYSLGPCTISMR